MALRYSDVVTQLRANSGLAVSTRLSIHDTDRGAFYGYGALLYEQGLTLTPNHVADVLTASGLYVKVLNNLAFDPAIQGSWGEAQTFLVARAELWDVTVTSIRSTLPFATRNPPAAQGPSLGISAPGHANAGVVNVPLEERAGLLYGIGPSPLEYLSAQALYVVTFVEITSPPSEIGPQL